MVNLYNNIFGIIVIIFYSFSANVNASIYIYTNLFHYNITGKHKMVLLQIQKDQNKLEKTLLQLQRELRQLEHAHKATRLGMVYIIIYIIIKPMLLCI